MPVYEFQCKECLYSFSEKRRMIHSNDPATCPRCKSVGDYRSVSKGQLILPKDGDFEYDVSKGLGKAKEERQEYEKKFGKYEKLAGTTNVSERRNVSGLDPDEDITYMGNVGDDKKMMDDAARSGLDGD